MTENITTIQIRENVKQQLDRLKNGKKTYEEIIICLMKTAEKCKRAQRELMEEGCKEMAQESLRITREWEATDSKLDWKW